jgi:predicted amidohydrolase
LATLPPSPSRPGSFPSFLPFLLSLLTLSLRRPPHWEVLLRARAIETQCYVLAAAQVGENAPGRKTHGHAIIVSPWGDVLAQVADHHSPTSPETDEDDQGQFAVAEIELKWLEEIRKAMPLLDQRRGDVYPLL